MNYKVVARTARGGREINQDACVLVEENGRVAVIVCDGLGSYAGSEFASAVVARSLATSFSSSSTPLSSECSEEWVRVAHAHLLHEKEKAHVRSAATTVCGLFVADTRAILVSVGDTRLYRLRGSAVTRLTVDDSLADSQTVVNYLSFIPEQSQLLAAIGMGRLREVHVQELEVMVGDRYLMCTDGFWQYFQNKELNKCGTLERALRWYLSRLKHRAKKHNDNYTIALLDVCEGD